MRRTIMAIMAVVAVSTILSAVLSGPAEAGVRMSFTYAARPADIRVWLEADDIHLENTTYSGYDVYPTVESVVLSVRASRSCYATVYVVDTEGYIHVVYPMSPHDNTYLRGGRIYRFYLADFDFGGAFDRGVAYAFAVSSPVRFTYGHYGWGAFAGNFGWQIYGDPYLAARGFNLGLVPASCDYRVIGVSHARFYVRDYVRYPSYLCAGWHDYHGTPRYCRAGCEVYRQYSVHAKDPYRALRPASGRSKPSDGYTNILRTERWRSEAEANSVKSTQRSAPTAYETRAVRPIVKRTGARLTVKTRTVISSKNSFVQSKVQSKKDLSAVRRELAKRVSEERDSGVKSKTEPRHDAKVKTVTKRTHQVARAEGSSKSPTKTSKNSSSGDKSRSRSKERHEKR